MEEQLQLQCWLQWTVWLFKKYYLEEEEEEIIFDQVLNDEILINTKTQFLYQWKAFYIILHRKWFR